MHIKTKLFIRFIVAIFLFTLAFFCVEAMAQFINLKTIENELNLSFDKESAEIKKDVYERKLALETLERAKTENHDYEYWRTYYIENKLFDSINEVSMKEGPVFQVEIGEELTMYRQIKDGLYLKGVSNYKADELGLGEYVIYNQNYGVLTSTVDIFSYISNKTSPKIFGIDNHLFNDLFTFDGHFFIYRTLDTDMELSLFFLIEKNQANDFINTSFENMKLVVYALLLVIFLLIMASLVKSIRRDFFISKLTTCDKLTEVWNIERFKTVLQKKINKEKNTYTVYSFDICKFRFINEAMGRDFGDTLLCNLAHIISRNSSRKTLLARGNNDVFFLAKPDVNEKKRELIFTNIVEDINHEYKDENISILLDCGCYVVDSEKNVDVIVDSADITRKLIKGDELVHYAVYNPKLEQEIKRKNELESWAKEGIEKDEFLTYFQPKAKFKDSKEGILIDFHGAEALVRWLHNGEMISPGAFIPLFEDNGFIVEFDFYMFKKVCEKLRDFLNNAIDFDVVSINFSRRHLGDPDFVKHLDSIRNQYKIPAEKIEIEILEGVFLDGYQDMSRVCQKLRQSKYRIAIDDFGSGYSSLNALKNIKADVIKLDKGFFLEEGKKKKQKDDKENQEKNQKILKGIVQMISDLGMDVVFEGVENEEILDQLKEMCKCYIKANRRQSLDQLSSTFMIQGYFYSKPIPCEEFRDFMLQKLKIRRESGNGGKDKCKETARPKEDKVQ